MSPDPPQPTDGAAPPPEPDPFPPFAVLERRHVYASAWCRLRRDVVDVGDGRAQEYHVFEVPDAAVVVPVLADGRIVLIGQYRYPHGRTHWEVPAGRVDAGEAPAAAAARELREEAGCRAGRLVELPGFYPLNGISDHYVHAFAALGCTLEGDARPDRAERIYPRAFAPAQVRALLRAGQLRDAFSALALFHYFEGAPIRP